MLSSLVWESNRDKSLENRHGGKKAKAGNGRKVWLRPRVSEKENRKDFGQPYREPGKVLWLKRLRRIGITVLREFGKLAPYVCYKGCLLCRKQVAVTRGVRLFIKNTGSCKFERMCTGTDLCSLPVGETPVQGS